MDSLLIVKGLALSHNEFPPWLEAVNKTARDLSPADATEINLANSMIVLLSEDPNPMCAKKGNMISRKGRCGCTQNKWARGEGNPN